MGVIRLIRKCFSTFRYDTGGIMIAPSDNNIMKKITYLCVKRFARKVKASKLRHHDLISKSFRKSKEIVHRMANN